MSFLLYCIILLVLCIARVLICVSIISAICASFVVTLDMKYYIQKKKKKKSSIAACTKKNNTKPSAICSHKCALFDLPGPVSVDVSSRFT